MVLYYLLAVFASMAQGSTAWMLPQWGLLACGLVVIAAWYINATAINDISDYDIDQVNLRRDADRPLITGVVSSRSLVVIAVLAGVVALAAAWPLGLAVTAWVGILLGFNAAYSLRPIAISRRGGLALALLPLGYVGLTMPLGVAVGGGRWAGGVWLLIALCYVQFVARLSLKDYRDVVGDAKHGKQTFLLRRGNASVVRLALTMHWIAAGLAVWWLYAESPLQAIAYLFLAAAAAGLLLRLRQAATWPHQRSWIAGYGRLVTGQAAVLLLDGLARADLMAGELQTTMLLILVVATFGWSVRRVLARLRP